MIISKTAIVVSRPRAQGMKAMALQAPFTITVNPKTDALDISQGRLMSPLKGYPVTPGGVYKITFDSKIFYYGSNLPMNKVVIYNTSDWDAYGWFYTVNAGGAPLTVQMGQSGTQCNMLYAFVIDITTGDNSGSGTLTVTQIA